MYYSFSLYHLPKIEIKKDDKTRSQIHSGTFLNPFLLSDLLGFNRLK
nr:MAG TPA: hypothetical protein [Caudoviricetes sp.]